MANETPLGDGRLDVKDYGSDHGDTEKNHAAVDVANGEVQEDLALEKRVLRKLDANLVTLLCLLYLMSFLGEFTHDNFR
jgi:hypothetical protein